MTLLRKLAAILLLALWLPVTQHCALEAAGLTAAVENDVACAHENRAPCADDSCHLVEQGSYASTHTVVKVLAPNPVLSAILVFLVPAEVFQEVPDPEAALASYDRPKDSSPTWCFVERAAGSPRAPSLS